MKLKYYTFCPFSRSLRIALIEKNIDFSLEILDPQLEDEEIIISPNNQIPALIDGISRIWGCFAQYEYLEAKYKETSLYSTDLIQSSEIRRLIMWIDFDFFNFVSSKIIQEKILNRLEKKSPNSVEVRQALKNLNYHLEYFDFLTQKRKWLAGENFSLADIVAGSHLSILDYLNEIRWDDYKHVKEWYMKLKSKPSFQEMLQDNIPGILPSEDYRNLDF